MNAHDLKQIDDLIEKRVKNLATKDDLKRELRGYPTKKDLQEELKRFVSRDDLKNFATKEDLSRFATKNDLKDFAKKGDLKNFATKDDLKLLGKDLESKMDDVASFIISSIDKHKADKRDLDSLEKRVEKAEEALHVS
ncbi:MAG: hypothetical protein A2857_03625 [Candidatus Levybacteria bacterium RIFCSPHIGHO2_01_FULL_36_15]|nr:MAG: hypothetical protein A2857_03625 [Candidatus Levybacteria bacterium RIFCSPHIGHO2_01_FULL_36_15]OGH37230.1 MAG: hypothetical protein A2905_06015 [Candidatus Levybacteria bacterium RIFCSPLOWO2_01_FULL_36_10]